MAESSGKKGEREEEEKRKRRERLAPNQCLFLFIRHIAQSSHAPEGAWWESSGKARTSVPLFILLDSFHLPHWPHLCPMRPPPLPTPLFFLSLHRIYGSGGAEDDDAPFVDVPPKAGTLVLFRSDTVPHEVLETSAERLAIAGKKQRTISIFYIFTPTCHHFLVKSCPHGHVSPMSESPSHVSHRLSFLS